ncbi:hypothetical protein [Flavobacterium sp.]|uniref:hypothetical protein n=1 Tax=Flavobacterium sp. TaxID=239 RepID=UPI0011FF57AB|nr:hypothetical protein [Flavobacterium sp.]RZJ73210.1 MAG: hypothetical protein EOO49_02570 [Flavobacterium sp.]
MATDKLNAFFERAILLKDANLAEEAITAVFSQEKPNIFENYLSVLLVSDWHFRHEDIAHLLQTIASPKSVGFLLDATTLKFGYLAYDDSHALARKCVWALADIGTGEAKAALTEISKNEDPKVAGYAQKRLDKWTIEVSRKNNNADEKRI